MKVTMTAVAALILHLNSVADANDLGVRRRGVAQATASALFRERGRKERGNCFIFLLLSPRNSLVYSSADPPDACLVGLFAAAADAC